ncbi:MAG: hypothetical protein ACRD9S_22285 [Pyrinomonadaceae bacterium]
MTAIKSKRVLVLIAVLIVLSCALYALFSFRRGKVIESWQTGNDVFAIRVTAHSERLSLPGLGGAYYVFDSSVLGSDRWTEFLVFRHDNSVSIPRDQVRFVTPQVAYVFMGWKYGITTDGGSTWSVWDAEKDLPDWQCCNYSLIRDVRIAPDGTGTMKLNPPSGLDRQVSELQTKDYGRRWNLP